MSQFVVLDDACRPAESYCAESLSKGEIKLLPALALCVLLGVFSALGTENTIMLFLSAVLVLALSFLSRLGKTFSFVLVFALILSFFWTRFKTANHDELADLVGKRVSISGSVEKSATASGALELACESLNYPGSRRLSTRVYVQPLVPGDDCCSNPTYPLGAHVRVKGLVLPAVGKTFPFEFDRGLWLSRRNIAFTLSRARVETGDPGEPALLPWLSSYFTDVRTRLVYFHEQCLGKEVGDLLGSIVLGDKAVSISSELRDKFNRVGLSHLLAASGMNMTIIVAFVVFLVSSLKSGRNYSARLQIALSAFAVVSFCLLAGPSPSVNRAAVMCIITLMAQLIWRRVSALTCLSLALILAVMLEPSSLLDIGLQLSYCATFGVIVLSPVFEGALDWFNWRWTGWLKTLVAVVLSAQVAVLPVQLMHFGRLSLLFLPANVLAEPLIAPATVLGFISSLSALCAPLLPLARLVEALAAWPTQALLHLANWLGCLPFSSISLAAPSPATVFVYFVLLLILARLSYLAPSRKGLYALLLTLLFSLEIAISLAITPALEVLATRGGVIVERRGLETIVIGAQVKLSESYLHSRPFEKVVRIVDLAPTESKTLSFRKCGDAYSLYLKEEKLKFKLSLAERLPTLSIANCAVVAAPEIERLHVSCSGYPPHLNLGGDLGFARCLPYLPIDLPLYPTLHVEKICTGAGYFLRFGL